MLYLQPQPHRCDRLLVKDEAESGTNCATRSIDMNGSDVVVADSDSVTV
jgi:hypothetical protein